MPKRPEKVEAEWPASKVELRQIGEIVPYDHNPRTHPPAQIELIASSMREDGVTAPIMVDEDSVILYGHGRLLAAQKNGFKKYPVIVARGLTEERKRALRIKDNSLAALSGWDSELMRFEIESLRRGGYDVKLLGFGDTQLVQFETRPGPPDGFQTFDESIPVDHQCPRCGYRGSGDWSVKAEPEPKKNGKKGGGKK